MEDKKSFGRYVREKCTGLGLSQRELAGKLFVTESAVSKWERGVSYPDITQVTPLCEALGVSEHELVTASDDWRQRKLEAEADAHRKTRALWLWGIDALYVLIVVGVACSAFAGASRPIDAAVAAAACLICASFTHVPVLVRNERGAAVLLAFYVSLNLCVAAGIAGGDSASWQADFGVAFVALLFAFVLLAGPFLLTWACKRMRSSGTLAAGSLEGEGRPAGEGRSAAPQNATSSANSAAITDMLLRHRALICLAADTVLLLCLVAVVSAYGGGDAAYVAQMMAIAGVLVVPVWTTFLAVWYLPAALPFRLAVAFAAVGLWLFFAGGVVNLILGLPFDWHAAVNFADWASYPATNDNLCWLILVICLVAAGALCFAGAFRRTR